MSFKGFHDWKVRVMLHFKALDAGLFLVNIGLQMIDKLLLCFNETFHVCQGSEDLTSSRTASTQQHKKED